MNQFFKDLKIIELANVLAGPSVGMFFAELGATVIKIENSLTDGDITRKWKLTSEDPSKKDSFYYSSVNYGKESCLLNVTDSKDRSILDGMIKEADIVISNYKPSFRQKHSFSYADFKKLKADIIYAELNAYPEDEKPAFDILLQAETGYLAMCGNSKEQLAKIPVALIDVITGHQLKEAVLMALIQKERTGEGSFVKTSLYECAIASLVNQAANYLQGDFIPQPNGTQHTNIAPYGDIYYDQDGRPLVLAVGTENQFLSLLKCLYIEVKDDWLTNQLRLKNRASLNRAIQEKVGFLSKNDIDKFLSTHGVPYAYICSIGDLLSNKEQLKGMILEDRIVKSVAFEII